MVVSSWVRDACVRTRVVTVNRGSNVGTGARFGFEACKGVGSYSRNDTLLQERRANSGKTFVSFLSATSFVHGVPHEC